MNNIIQAVSAYISPNSQEYHLAIKACVHLLNNLNPPVMFLTPSEIEMSEQHEGIGLYSFDRAQRGELLMWGTQEGETYAIIKAIDGRVHLVNPTFVKFIRQNEAVI